MTRNMTGNENGNFGFNRWIDICINLLQHIKDDGLNISRKQIERMNIRNVGDVVTSSMVCDYMEAPISVDEEDSSLDKFFYGKQIYVRKMERLYYRIRLYKMREWWE